jgi:hypothetical protein
MTAPVDILGLGCVAVDDLLYVAAYPPADAKVQVRCRERQGGGPTATALVAAARLGSACACAATLGTVELSAGAPTTGRALLRERGLKAEVEADGGIRRETVPLLHAAGADWIVPGSLMFKEDPPAMRRWLASL